MTKMNKETMEFLKRVYPLVTCPVCKKKFVKPSGSWAYKIHYNGYTRRFCSYSCMRVFQKKIDSEKKEAKKRKRGFIRGAKRSDTE